MIRDRRPDTDAEREAEIDAGVEQPPTESEDTETGRRGTREDEEKLKENREQLGVEEDHKTPDMKRGHRGTFP